MLKFNFFTRANLVAYTTVQRFRTFCSKMAKKNALLVVADGSEEMETVISADVLRRAGVDVTVASLSNNTCVKCSREIKICTDAKFADVTNNTYDAIVLPGGLEGSKAFQASAELGELLKKQHAENRVIAAICAAPLALKAHGIAKGKSITAYPLMKTELADDYNYVDDKVVISDNIITSQGPATTFAFALSIVEKLINKETAGTTAKGLLYDYQ